MQYRSPNPEGIAQGMSASILHEIFGTLRVLFQDEGLLNQVSVVYHVYMYTPCVTCPWVHMHMQDGHARSHGKFLW